MLLVEVLFLERRIEPLERVALEEENKFLPPIVVVGEAAPPSPVPNPTRPVPTVPPVAPVDTTACM